MSNLDYNGNPPSKTITFSRVVELSHPIHQAMPQWPGDPSVEFETVADFDRHGFFLRRFSMGEHSGTHLNAPLGFHSDGASVGELSAEQLVVAAAVIDVREQAATDRDYALTRTDLREWEGRHGPIPEGCLALLYTGWQEKPVPGRGVEPPNPRRDTPMARRPFGGV